MRMLLPKELVAVHVGVGLSHRPLLLVLVMRVMHVAIAVLDGLMDMLMVMVSQDAPLKP